MNRPGSKKKNKIASKKKLSVNSTKQESKGTVLGRTVDSNVMTKQPEPFAKWGKLVYKIKKHWLTILIGGLVILVGFFSDLIPIGDYFNRRPDLTGGDTGFMTDEVFEGESEGKRTMIFRTMSIINKGGKPCYPGEWKLRFRREDGPWLIARHEVIPNPIINILGETILPFDSTGTHELGNIKSINPDENIIGNIFFTTNEVPLSMLRAGGIEYVLSVEDLKTHQIFEFPRKSSPPLPRGQWRQPNAGYNMVQP